MSSASVLRDKLADATKRARAALTASARATRDRTRSVLRWKAEILQAVALLGGWAAITRGIRSFIPSRVDVWSISVGLLLLSLCGWRFLYVLGRSGLYAISRKSEARQ